MLSVTGSKSIAPPLENFRAIGLNSLESLKPSGLLKDWKSVLGTGRHILGAERTVSLSMAPWETIEQALGPQSNIYAHPVSLFADGNKNSFQYENDVFSSSLSEMFNRELRLSAQDALCFRPIGTVSSNFEEDEPFESLEEIDNQTVRNLLPDDDELLSGIIDDIECISRPNSGIDVEDDVFCIGGMELEADDSLNGNKSLNPANGVSDCQHEMLNCPFPGEYPYRERPSRKLFVRNINSSIEDSELSALFEQYGDIHTLYTGFKHHGFVTISYYDIRSACNALKALQNKPLRQRKLDIHFLLPKDNPSEKDQGAVVVQNFDSSISNDDLRQIFGIYGSIKEIYGTPHSHHHKFIEFYDVRAAQTARCALNRSDISEKQINLEPSGPGDARRSMQQFSTDLEQEVSNVCCQQGIPSNNSLLGDYGSINLGGIASYSHENGSLQGIHSTVRSPHPTANGMFGGVSPNIPHSLSSPVRVASVGNHSNQCELELSRSLGEMNLGFEYMPTPHSCSLPEDHDGVSTGIPLNSPIPMSSMAININSRSAQDVDDSHMYRAGSCGPNNLSYEYNGALGTSGNGDCPLHGQQYIWSRSNSHHHHHPKGQMIWQNSASFNDISASPAQFHGLQRAPAHMLNTAPPLHSRHVGLAPHVNSSLWARRHAYAGNASNASDIHLGSLGSMGFSGCSTPQTSELTSPNMFAHIGGSFIEPSMTSPHVGLPSPQQRSHTFHGRTSMVPVPASFNVTNDRIRSRRSDANSNQADNRKQYELDIERVSRGEDSRTTLMIKNIPNKYTSKMLLAAIDERHRGTYDFIYLPIDFKNKCNVGYAFINMIEPQQIIPFFKTFNGKKWEKFNSEKVASLAYARIQGKAALIAHFQNSSLMNEDKRCRPILFHTDGPNAGDQEPFPMGLNIRSRPGRSRTTSSEDHHQLSPSTPINGEVSPNGTGSSSWSDKDPE